MATPRPHNCKAESNARLISCEWDGEGPDRRVVVTWGCRRCDRRWITESAQPDAAEVERATV
jgi:hypothetical protein